MSDLAAADGPGNGSLRRYAAIGLVALVHLTVLWGLRIGMGPQFPRQMDQDLQVTVFNPSMAPQRPPAPPLSWMFQAPEEAVVPEPEIDIAPDNDAVAGISAVPITGRLAPRLDPRHVNERPQLPGTLGNLIAMLSLRLRVLVLPDGSVGEAMIARSSGQGEIDQLAVNWIKDNWRFLPALINDRPVEAWTTVIVRFAPIH